MSPCMAGSGTTWPLRAPSNSDRSVITVHTQPLAEEHMCTSFVSQQGKSPCKPHCLPQPATGSACSAGWVSGVGKHPWRGTGRTPGDFALLLMGVCMAARQGFMGAVLSNTLRAHRNSPQPPAGPRISPPPVAVVGRYSLSHDLTVSGFYFLGLPVKLRSCLSLRVRDKQE